MQFNCLEKKKKRFNFVTFRIAVWKIFHTEENSNWIENPIFIYK